EDDGFEAAAADVPLNRADRYGVCLAFDPASPRRGGEVAGGDENPHGGLSSTNDLGGAGVDGELKQLEHPVGGELLSGALVAFDRLGPGALGLGDEAGAAAPRGGDL